MFCHRTESIYQIFKLILTDSQYTPQNILKIFHIFFELTSDIGQISSKRSYQD